MKYAVAGACVTLLFAGQAAQAEILLIDDFITSQSVTQTGTGSSSDSVAASEALGGTRDIVLTVGAGGGESEALVNSTGNERFRFNNPTVVSSNAAIQWDGNGSSDLDTGGLGGLDFSIYDDLRFGVFASDQEAEITFDVYSSETEVSQATFAIPADVDDEVFSIPFVAFAPTGSDGGADLSSVGAVTAAITGEPALDIQLEFVEAASEVPEPAPLAMLSAGLVGLFMLRRPDGRARRS
ncbi:MAG: hypothetical protein CMM50_00930 [Rhodospirillaceae bacterium]|jgi:hypothetical protein|nr:hypothetical protein [Rhodospirillaceae bacterium]